METKRGKRVRLGPVSKYFVEAAKQIPEVQLIILHYGDETRVWTIIDAPLFDRTVTKKIFSIEIEAYNHGDEEIGFRVTNVQDIPGGLSALHLEGMPVLFQRKREAA
jgi:hypothetical protein